ncbi:MAG: PEP-CTERM sorting domain-containing protein, partial [Bythopirellula sp.]
GDVFTNFTEVEMNQFNTNGTGNPTFELDSYSVAATPIPEPGSFAIATSALFLLGFRRRRSQG